MNAARRVSFLTLGCRLNQAETALIAEGFRRDGYEVVAHGDPAEVAVIHTCSVTERADARARNEIRKIMKRSPDAIVCAVGCYAQAEPAKVAEIPGVDLVVGTDRKYRLAELVAEAERAACEAPHLVDESNSAGPRVEVTPRPDNGAFDYAGAGHYPHTTRANVKIQDGCDFCCAFCILPRVRGRARSRRLGEIVAEASELVRRGHRELVVTGVNVGTYAFEEYSIADVARALAAIDEGVRVRISSIEPTTVPDDLLDWMAESPQACRHLHLPLQSADDAILESMRRVYRFADYASFVERATTRVPELGLGTDVVVGFPGETDAAFERTLRAVESLPFAYVHVFPYSDRPKTVADRLGGKVHAKTIKERAERLRAVAAVKRADFLERLVGTTERVLFETVDRDGLRKGLTGNYARVGVDAEAAAENDWLAVHITGIENRGREPFLEGDIRAGSARDEERRPQTGAVTGAPETAASRARV